MDDGGEYELVLCSAQYGDWRPSFPCWREECVPALRFQRWRGGGEAVVFHRPSVA